MPDPVVYTEVPADADPGVSVRIDEDDDHHLRTVLRMDRGEPLVVADGEGRMWPAELAGPAAAVISGRAAVTPQRQPRLHVVQGLPKGRAIEEVIRMLVELGVDRVTPVSSARTVRELRGAKRDREHDRWCAVAVSAARQSRRAWLPHVDPLSEMAGVATETSAGVVPHVGAPRGLADVAPDLDHHDEVAVAVGPEGGWTDGEIATWVAGGLIPVTLGDGVLRTEHAAFAACAALAYALGRMDGTSGATGRT